MRYLFLLLLPLTGFAKDFIPASFSANFEQSFLSKATGKDKKSFGKIDYKYPGHIRLEMTSPDPSTFVSNSQKSWYYTPPFVEGESGQVTIQRSSKLPLTKFLDSLKGGLEGSKLFTAQYKDKELVLAFNPQSQKELTLKEVVLLATKAAKDVGSLNEFEKLTLVYTNGNRVDMKFIDLKQDANFLPNHFNFTVPEKTKVTNN